MNTITVLYLYRKQAKISDTKQKLSWYNKDKKILNPHKYGIYSFKNLQRYYFGTGSAFLLQ